MVGTGSRLFFALALLGLIGAGAYGVASGGDPVGVMSGGWKGGVGDHLGYAVLTFFGLASLILGFFTVAIRDADPMPVAVGGGDPVVPQAAPPADVSFWPLIGALGMVMTVIGLVEGEILVVVGLIMIAVTAIEWTVRAWADRATGDPVVNDAIRNRLMSPLEVPIAAVLVIGFVVLAVSRVLLAVTSFTAVMVAIVASVLIAVGSLVVYRSQAKSRTVAAVLIVIAVLALIAGGIAGIAHGSRSFDEEEPGHEAAE